MIDTLPKIDLHDSHFFFFGFAATGTRLQSLVLRKIFPKSLFATVCASSHQADDRCFHALRPGE